MKTIQIEEDVFDFLVSKRQGFETESETLRRELGISSNGSKDIGAGHTSSSRPAPTAPSTSEHREIRDFLQSPEFLVESRVAGKFLAILGWLCRRDQKKFEAVFQMSGHSRKYFGRSSQELEQSGNGVQPRRIPHSLFWADTNNDTMRKRKILASAMRILRCSDDTIREAVLALR